MSRVLTVIRSLSCQPQLASGTVANMQAFSSRFTWQAGPSVGAAVRCQARRMAKTATPVLDVTADTVPASASTSTAPSRKKSKISTRSSRSKVTDPAAEISSAPSSIATSAASDVHSTASPEEPAVATPATPTEESQDQSLGSQQQQQQEESAVQDGISLLEAYAEVEREAQTSPFPEEDYKPIYQNVVTLTGTISSAPELQELRSGTDIAKFMMRVRRPGTSMIDTYMMESWGDIARRMVTNLKEGDRVQINGSLKKETWLDREGKRQYSMLVTATACWMIAPGSIPKEIDVMTPQQLWQEFQEYPARFWDNRETKRNPRAPDYTHKDSGDAIWINSPPKGNAGSSAGGPGVGFGVPAAASAAAAEYGSDYDAASAVSPGGFESAGQQASQAAQPSGGFQSPFGAQPTGGPGFGQNQQIGFGARPAAQSTSGGGAPSGSFQSNTNKSTAYKSSGPADREQLWEEFRTQPGNFWDNRNKKFNPKAPDFKHKVTGGGLWVSSSPSWFDVSQHPPAPAAGAAGTGAPRKMSDDVKQLWELFDKQPNDFWDNRAKKTNPKAPDFVHKTTRGALWVNSKPDWVSLDALGHEQFPTSAQSSSYAAPMQAATF